MIRIRKAAAEDKECIWQIIRQLISGGDSYVFDPCSSREEMLGYWCGPDKHTYVVQVDEKLAGTFILKDNFTALGSHVA